MPKVGDKHFSYSESGKKAARKYAQETGGKVDYGSSFKMKGSPAKRGKIQGTSGYRSAVKQVQHEQQHVQQSSRKDKLQKPQIPGEAKRLRFKEWLMTERGFNQADADRMIKEGAYTEKDMDVPAEPKGKSPAKQSKTSGGGKGEALNKDSKLYKDAVNTPVDKRTDKQNEIIRRVTTNPKFKDNGGWETAPTEDPAKGKRWGEKSPAKHLTQRPGDKDPYHGVGKHSADDYHGNPIPPHKKGPKKEDKETERPKKKSPVKQEGKVSSKYAKYASKKQDIPTIRQTPEKDPPRLQMKSRQIGRPELRMKTIKKDAKKIVKAHKELFGKKLGADFIWGKIIGGGKKAVKAHKDFGVNLYSKIYKEGKKLRQNLRDEASRLIDSGKVKRSKTKYFKRKEGDATITEADRKKDTVSTSPGK